MILFGETYEEVINGFILYELLELHQFSISYISFRLYREMLWK